MKSIPAIEAMAEKFPLVNQNNRSFASILQYHLMQKGGKVKSYVFDFKNLKIYEGNTDHFDAEITIDDDDLFDVLVTKKKTFRSLFNEGGIKIKGDHNVMDKFDAKIKIHTHFD